METVFIFLCILILNLVKKIPLELDFYYFWFELYELGFDLREPLFWWDLEVVYCITGISMLFLAEVTIHLNKYVS